MNLECCLIDFVFVWLKVILFIAFNSRFGVFFANIFFLNILKIKEMNPLLQMNQCIFLSMKVLLVDLRALPLQSAFVFFYYWNSRSKLKS